MIHLSDTITASNQDRDEKASMKAQTASESGAAKGKLAATKTALAEDEKVLAEMGATYKTKSAQYEENQKVRAGELEALAKAIEIIASPEVSGSLLQKSSQPIALLQLGSASKRSAAKERALAMLRKSAHTLKSKVLADAANQISANPFAKVIGMIKDMIAKLKEEAAAEAAHKGWCDQQLYDNKMKRDKKTAKVNLLTAQIEELTASIETMGKTIETLVKEQADLTEAVKVATAQREKENAKNTKTIEEAKVGAEAVGKALTVLKEFYAKQSFLQEGKQAPEMAAYKGNQNAKGGVVGMMEVIQSDFLRLESDTTTEEEEAAAEFETFVADATADKEAKHKEEVQTKLDKDQAELDKANEYYESLKPQCLEVKVSYEERVAKRKQEIESLKEAYKVLDE